MVRRGEFREDLYYRLRGIVLEVPPLRARMRDLPKLAPVLLERFASERAESEKTLTADALALLMRHTWPGNVRELENCLHAAAAFANGDAISAADLVDASVELRTLAVAPAIVVRAEAPFETPAPPEPDAGATNATVVVEAPPQDAGQAAVEAAYAHVREGAASLLDIKRQIERDCIVRALADSNGVIARAAVLLGMKRPWLSQLVKQYGLMSSSVEDGS
jgi:transcriptional regulator with GAF, ATPase, and Fis domain